MARVVIVGAGVIGSMHALLARRAGHQVVLIEREEAARGASVRNFGLVWVSGRRPGAELELAIRARELWEELARDVPGVGFRANGSLTIAQTENELRVLEEVVAREDSERRGFRLLDADETRAVNPAVQGTVLAALYCARDGAVEPRLVPNAVREAAEVEWLPRRHVVEAGDGWVRDHTGGTYRGDVVILCPGAAHRGLAGWNGDDTSLRRVRLQMLETEPLGIAVTTSLADGDSLRYYPAFDVPARAALQPQAEVAAQNHMQLLLQQRLDGCLTIGDTHAYDEPFDVATLQEPYEHLRERVESILGRALPPIRRRWAGVYSQATPDVLYHFQQIGERTAVVTGVGGRGMTLSPAVAEHALRRLDLL